jgi:hypothetical protein
MKISDEFKVGNVFEICLVDGGNDTEVEVIWIEDDRMCVSPTDNPATQIVLKKASYQ